MSYPIPMSKDSFENDSHLFELARELGAEIIKEQAAEDKVLVQELAELYELDQLRKHREEMLLDEMPTRCYAVGNPS